MAIPPYRSGKPMRPPNEAARRQLRAVLRPGPIPASAVASQLGVSPRTALRILAEFGPEVVALGPPGRRRYASVRPIRGDPAPQPVFAIDPDGRANQVATFHLLEREGSFCDLGRLGWPVDDPSRDGWWPGLPYPWYDLQPQGFLGRLFARREHASLEVGSDPRGWNDTDIAWVLTRRGADLTGNLIVGEPALRLHQGRLLDPEPASTDSTIAADYVRRAESVVSMGVPGSSAAGEFPKFPAVRERDGMATPHVLVKFSGQIDASTPERWSDLLVAEHIALATLGKVHPVATTRIVQAGGRTFLESERFDRHGGHGRSPLVSLAALAGHLLGRSDTDWRTHATALARLGRLDAADVERTIELWWFGRLIANTDMHLGNLSFVPRDGRLALAPAYDMLPMAYAPLPGGEIPPDTWAPELPLPAEAAAWRRMCGPAIDFWTACTADERISATFRTTCAKNAERLARLAGHA